jgi:hypothetical protein
MRKVSCVIFRLYLSDSCESTQRRTIIKPRGGAAKQQQHFLLPLERVQGNTRRSLEIYYSSAFKGMSCQAAAASLEVMSRSEFMSMRQAKMREDEGEGNRRERGKQEEGKKREIAEQLMRHNTRASTSSTAAAL